jgi:predicted metal-dependent peptidase
MLYADINDMIKASMIRIGAKNAFFGALLMFARHIIVDTIETVATDGRDIYYNQRFWRSMTAAERDGVMLHEVLHAALLHVPRRGVREKRRWNVAADIVVNALVLEAGYLLPKGHLRDQKLEKYSVEEVYALLSAEAAASPLILDLLADPGNQQQPSPSDYQQPNDYEKLQDYWQQAKGQAQALVQWTAHDSLSTSFEREFALVGSQLDWRSQLWRYLVRVPHDYGGFDRRFVGDELYIEQLEGETLRLSICVDTSGSIAGDQMNMFLSEVKAILACYPHLKVDLYYADAQLYGPYELMAADPLPQPRGGDGTDFRPFFEAIKQRASGEQLAVYLTDGFGDFPQSANQPATLWAVVPGGLMSGDFPFGEVVRLIDH